MATGKQIKHYRLKLGWTLERLESESGVATGSIHALERRDSERSKYFQAIAGAFGMTVEQLSDVANDWPIVNDRIKAGTETLTQISDSAQDYKQNHPLAVVTPAQTAINDIAAAMRVIAIALAQADQSDRNAAKAYLVELCDRPEDVDTFAAKLQRTLIALPAQANATRQ